MLKTLFFLVFSAAMLCIPVGFKRLTHGFRVTKLRIEVPFRSDWEFSFPREEILQIFKQPFFYLGRGAQCYVFASLDDKYVLKLFRYDQPLNPLRNFFRSRIKKISPKTPPKEKIEHLLSACAIAYRLGKEETALLSMHLNLTERLFPKVKLHIPLGRTLWLPLDQYRFALQKKAETSCDVFTRIYRKGDKEEAKKLLSSLFELFQKRQAKGIWNLDLNFSRNFGFIEGKAVEIDFGNYVSSNEEGLAYERGEFSFQLSRFFASVAPEWKHLVEEL